MKQRESIIQDQVRLALNHPDGCWHRNNIGSAVMNGGMRVSFGVGGAGGADLIGLFRGRFVAVEIKTPIGRQSAEQKVYQRLVESKGGVYAIVRSVEDAHALLAELERRFPVAEAA